MPVAIVLPAVAGLAASAIATTAFAVGTFGAIAIGAVAGAVVGGIGAAIIGGDILESVLYGAVGGAVGGYLGGAFTTGEWALFGAEGGTANISSGAFMEGGAAEFGLSGAQVTGLEGTGSLLATDTAVTVGGGATSTGFGSLSDMAQYGLISGGADMLKGLGATEPYGNTKEAQDAMIAASKEKSQMEIDAQKEIARLNAETARANQELSDATTRAGYASQEKQAAEAIAQRKLELMTPIEQAALSRERARETASGLTLARKQAEKEINPYASVA